jgi:hypothetical protein
MRSVTLLAHNSGDDFPLAALKHSSDARKLLAVARYDGAAYLAGYVVECVAKTIILHDRAYNFATRQVDPNLLNDWHSKLRYKPYGHALLKLVTETLSSNGQNYAHFLPAANDSIVAGWQETLRYRAEHFSAVAAREYVSSASLAENAIIQMELDGVL